MCQFPDWPARNTDTRRFRQKIKNVSACRRISLDPSAIVPDSRRTTQEQISIAEGWQGIAQSGSLLRAGRSIGAKRQQPSFGGPGCCLHGRVNDGFTVLAEPMGLVRDQARSEE